MRRLHAHGNVISGAALLQTDLIRNNLARIGGLTDIEVPPVLGMDEPFRYRNKAQFPVGYDRDGNIVTGFTQDARTVSFRAMTASSAVT